mmetsp:Transcript_54594/g.152329  ORF Transcript_54594/g.152329 Transcript_54594/m.152329 type:complete len:580 (+) Transcript_54594:123-1862(+)
MTAASGGATASRSPSRWRPSPEDEGNGEAENRPRGRSASSNCRSGSNTRRKTQVTLKRRPRGAILLPASEVAKSNRRTPRQEEKKSSTPEQSPAGSRAEPRSGREPHEAPTAVRGTHAKRRKRVKRRREDGAGKGHGHGRKGIASEGPKPTEKKDASGERSAVAADEPDVATLPAEPATAAKEQEAGSKAGLGKRRLHKRRRRKREPGEQKGMGHKKRVKKSHDDAKVVQDGVGEPTATLPQSGADEPAGEPRPLGAKAARFRELIRGIYQRHNPSKADAVESLMEKYVGAEDEVYSYVCHKYGEVPEIDLGNDTGGNSLANGGSVRSEGGLQPPARAQPAGFGAAPKGFARKASAPPPPALSASLQVKSHKVQRRRNKEALAFLEAEIKAPVATASRVPSLPPRAEASTESGWPFIDEEFTENSSSSSDSDVLAYAAPLRCPPVSTMDLYGDLYLGPGDVPPARAPGTIAAPPPPPRPPSMTLEAFLGEWRDSIGHSVHVYWSPNGSHHRGELEVVLAKKDRSSIRLNVKSSGGGHFVCGHYDLDVERSHALRVVWVDMRNRGKSSVWDRVVPGAAVR